MSIEPAWGGAARGSSWSFSVTNVEWHEQALCREVGSAMFFADEGEDGLLAAAKTVCSLCEVRTTCLEDALERGDRWGVLGGMSPRQRAREATERRRQGNPVPRVCTVCRTKFVGPRNHTVCSDDCRRESRRRTNKAS